RERREDPRFAERDRDIPGRSGQGQPQPRWSQGVGAIPRVEHRAEHLAEVRLSPAVMQRTRARPPVVVAVLAAIGIAFFVVPFVGLLQRAPWSKLADDLTDPVVRDALRLSLVCSGGATALAFVLGLPLAWVLARTELPGRRMVRALVLLPMVLPPV